MRNRHDVHTGAVKIKTKAITALSAVFLGITSLIIPLVFSGVANAVQVQNPPALPETDGTYNVPGHAKLKLRVIVHKAKNNHNKPSPNPNPTLVCSLADPDSATVDGLAGWHLPAGTWTYHLNTSSAPSLIGGSHMATLTASAFGSWSATYVGSQVNFTRGADTSKNRASFDGQNIISWGRASSSALAVTYTWYYTSTGQVAEVDTIFNNQFAWDWSSQSGCAYQNYYDAQDILTHELGHWMGLNDNYATTYTDNTMYGYGSPTEVKKDTLATGDISAVNSLY